MFLTTNFWVVQRSEAQTEYGSETVHQIANHDAIRDRLAVGNQASGQICKGTKVKNLNLVENFHVEKLFTVKRSDLEMRLRSEWYCIPRKLKRLLEFLLKVYLIGNFEFKAKFQNRTYVSQVAQANQGEQQTPPFNLLDPRILGCAHGRKAFDWKISTGKNW